MCEMCEQLAEDGEEGVGCTEAAAMGCDCVLSMLSREVSESWLCSGL